MRRSLMMLALLGTSVGLAVDTTPTSAAVTSSVAAVSVVNSPGGQALVGGPVAFSADGNILVARTNFDLNNPMTLFNRATGAQFNLAEFQLLTSDGRHVVAANEVRTIGGTNASLPPLPFGFTADNVADASADGGVVLTNAFNPSTLYTSAYIRVPGGTGAVDLNDGDTGQNLNRGARNASLSASGRYAAYVHVDFVAGCTTQSEFCVFEVYRRDLSDGSLVPVSLNPDGAESNGQEASTSISDDGRFVAFMSDATDLVAGATTKTVRLYRHDIVTGRTVLVTDDVATSGFGSFYVMTGDGGRFVYQSRTAHELRMVDLASGKDVPVIRQDTSTFPPCTDSPVMSRDGRSLLLRSCTPGAILEPAGAPTLGPSDLGLATLAPEGDTVGYVGVAPSRLYDSRNGETDTRPNLAAGAVVTVAVGGKGGVPADATAAVLNVTVTDAAGAGFVTVWPCDQQRPTASNLNYAAGQTIPNAVVAGLALDGTVCLYTHNAADLIVDVAGSFDAASSYGSAAPLRVLDTRADENPRTLPTLAAGSVTPLDVVTLADLPDSTDAVTLNVTVTKTLGAGFVTVYPCDADLPTASNLNYTAGQTIPNAVISQLAADGTVCLYTSNAADLIVDVNGFFPVGSGFTGLTPARLLDSRDGQTDVVPNLAGGSVTTLQVAGQGGVPADATTAVLNVTVTNPLAAGYVTVYPCDGELPTASNLNYTAGQTIPNMVVSKLSGTGTVCLFTQAAADLIVDVAGYLGGDAAV